MKTMSTMIFSFTLMAVSCFSSVREGFSLQANTAQYKGSDYSNAVQVERGITLDEAFDIAEAREDIDYFVYVKGGQMVLELAEEAIVDAASDPFALITYQRYITDHGKKALGHCRIFKHGDVVFFKKEGMWLGSAPGLADTYVKE